jgi:hypothetical protein
MAYRVISDSGEVTRAGATHRRGDHALVRNALLTGAALACVALLSAGAALFSGNRNFAGLPNDAVRPGTLRIALVDPVPQPIVRHDPRIPIETAETAMVTAQRDSGADGTQLDRPTAEQTDNIVPIPLPPTRPTTTASIAPPPERLADNEPTGSLGKLAGETDGAPAASVREARKPAATPRSRTAHEKLYGPVRLAALTPAASMPDTGTGLPRAPYDRQTAVYVIGDKTVYMPDGAALEAHSGYGSKMDDPRFVHVRMRGATPPHVYDLRMREALFHGVEAIRLIPIGGERAIFGRDGLLAHTYLLGPNGQSNGCVSFKNYDAFLDAFKAGKITRLAVLARLD